MVLVQDLPSLMWAANLVTEFHTPQWQVDAPGLAHRLVFHLDPGACDGRLVLRGRVVAAGAAGGRIEAYAKTSGLKGLHLLAAVGRMPSSDVSAYAKELAVDAERALPCSSRTG